MHLTRVPNFREAILLLSGTRWSPLWMRLIMSLFLLPIAALFCYFRHFPMEWMFLAFVVFIALGTVVGYIKTSNAEKLPPDDKECRLLTMRADCYYQFGLYDKSIRDYTRILTASSGDVKLYLGRGRSYEKLGNQQLASRDFESARRLGYMA